MPHAKLTRPLVREGARSSPYPVGTSRIRVTLAAKSIAAPVRRCHREWGSRAIGIQGQRHRTRWKWRNGLRRVPAVGKWRRCGQPWLASPGAPHKPSFCKAVSWRRHHRVVASANGNTNPALHGIRARWSTPTAGPPSGSQCQTGHAVSSLRCGPCGGTATGQALAEQGLGVGC